MATMVAMFKGTSELATRPFSIPAGTLYFMVRWQSNNEWMRVSVNGIGGDEHYSSFGGEGGSGESAVYASGSFYIEVSLVGDVKPWTVEVYLD